MVPLRSVRLAELAALAIPSAVVVAVVVLASACSGSDAQAPPATSSSTTSPGPTTSSTAPTTTVPAQDWASLYELACDEQLEVTVPGSPPTDLTSISGLAASRRHPGVVWAVEDSLEPADLVGLEPDGTEVGRIRVTGPPLPNLDWEALAVSTDDAGRSWVHVGDLGDNFGLRTSVRVLSFPEPDLDATSVEATTTELRYPDGRPNAEAMAVIGDTIWVLDKVTSGPTTLYRAAVRPDGGSDLLEPVASIELPGESVTALDVSPDASLLALRTNTTLRLFPMDGPDDLPAALDRTPCTTPPLPERQGESVAILLDRLGLLTVSEDEGGTPVDWHLTAAP